MESDMIPEMTKKYDPPVMMPFGKMMTCDVFRYRGEVLVFMNEHCSGGALCYNGKTTTRFFPEHYDNTVEVIGSVYTGFKND
jgi:hypothetical protein